MLNYEEVRETRGSKPKYDLGEAKRLVADGKFSMTKRITRFIRNHWDERARYAVAEIFDAMSADGFYRSITLDNIPGITADVYFVDFGGERWYVKFYIADGVPVVQMLSCNIDGYDH